MLQNQIKLLLISFLFSLTLLHAKPVSVDEIFTQRQQFKILASFSYININRKELVLSTISVPQANGSAIQIPCVSHANVNQDYLNFGLQMRYGVYKRVELFTIVNAFWQNSIAHVNGGGIVSQNRGDFGSWNLGVLVQAKKEGKAPSLFVGGSMDLLDQTMFSNNSKALQYFKGFSIFATSFYTIDPIVLLLQANFRLNLNKTLDGLSINNAETFTLSPMVYFAVNPYISLNCGIKYQYKTQDSMDGVMVSPQGSSLSYVFGVAYEIKAKLIFFADAEYKNTSEYSAGALNITLSYRI
ncbi:hypothetical protein CQA53_09260 [Helicobacter didelphidarum]|uniref:Uncharacterized protein n=1 Tax=Helicobacter didelphidarum TaxID=2040648 RepID=A0A3D8IBA8_9HELI|nr:hypothetical protein [Helicobacter didelphidarum]RDU62473.1 hypothetical protein CQA53_09260 [Helicobacter didelphidarum]